MSRDDATLVDIVEAARLVTEFARGYDEGRFLSDAETQSGPPSVRDQPVAKQELLRRPGSTR